MKHIILVGVLLFSTIIPGISQKVKYKDLFILLKAENYSDADKYLRVFLKEEPDHPSANYYMGRMLQSYLDEQDLVNNNDRIIELADSSVMYLNKSLNLTTEKYIKKHDDDYYEEFKRRDMRSAKFVVKISDVQLDMEERMAAVKKFKSDVSNLFVHFNLAVSFYDSTLNYYNILKEHAPSINALYFNSGPDQLLLFRRLASRYDSSIYNFNIYLNLMKEVGKKDEAQRVVENLIETYPLVNIIKPDFSAKIVEYLNFQEWAVTTEDIVLKQIYPLKKRMVSFDIRLFDLHDRIIKDSLDARPEIFRLATENVAREIVEFDELALPAAIYNYRIAEINIHSAFNYWHKVVEDTTHVGVKLDVLTDLRKQQRGNVSLLKSLTDANNENERLIFKEFITERYQDDNGMAEFIRLQTLDVQNDSLLLHTWLTKVKEEDKYTYWKEESIALKVGDQIDNDDATKFSTLMIDSISDRNLGFYAWMESASSLSLSFGISPSSRALDTLYSVHINPSVSSGQEIINLKVLSDAMEEQQRVWVLNTTDTDDNAKYKVQVFTTDLTKGAGWNKEFSVNGIPTSVKYEGSSQSVTLIGENEEPLIILDVSGEVLVNPKSGEG